MNKKFEFEKTISVKKKRVRNQFNFGIEFIVFSTIFLRKKREFVNFNQFLYQTSLQLQMRIPSNVKIRRYTRTRQIRRIFLISKQFLAKTQGLFNLPLVNPNTLVKTSSKEPKLRQSAVNPFFNITTSAVHAIAILAVHAMFGADFVLPFAQGIVLSDSSSSNLKKNFAINVSKPESDQRLSQKPIINFDALELLNEQKQTKNVELNPLTISQRVTPSR